MRYYIHWTLVVVLCLPSLALAGDLRITIPKRTKPTPVQKLNQEGVTEVRKHHIEKAEQLFYRAYLLDPDDPFTLNNLGYISEIEGKIERAEDYYRLASQHASDAMIAKATVPELEGKSFLTATTFVGSKDLRVNRGNIEAMRLLHQGRAQEAEQILDNTLQLDPRSAFTLNNLGYTMEAEGNLEGALRYYQQAAGLNSSDAIVVALDPRWRGKPVSEVAANNVKIVRRRIENEDSAEARASRLNLQGVVALNKGEDDNARNDFLQAYQLDPNSAFSINNMGYVSEMNGDQETADEFYDQAKLAPGAHQPVKLANHSEMSGMPLAEVANVNSQDSEANMEAMREARRRQGGPIELMHRNGTPVTDDANAPQSPAQQASPQANPTVPRPPEGQIPPPNNVPRPPQQP